MAPLGPVNPAANTGRVAAVSAAAMEAWIWGQNGTTSRPLPVARHGRMDSVQSIGYSEACTGSVTPGSNAGALTPALSAVGSLSALGLPTVKSASCLETVPPTAVTAQGLHVLPANSQIETISGGAGAVSSQCRPSTVSVYSASTASHQYYEVYPTARSSASAAVRPPLGSVVTALPRASLTPGSPPPPSLARTSVATGLLTSQPDPHQVVLNRNGSESVTSTGETMDTLRAEIGDLRAEVQSLRSALTAGFNQRDEIDHNRGGGPALTARSHKQLRRKDDARAQPQEARRLRSEGTRHQERQESPRRESPRRRSDLHEDGSQRGGRSGSPGRDDVASPSSRGSSPRTARPPRAAMEGPANGSSSPSSQRRSTSAGKSRYANTADEGYIENHAVPEPTPPTLARSASDRLPGRPLSPRRQGCSNAGRADDIDAMWCAALQRFPQYPEWVLVKEKPGVYRMGSPCGKKVLCRVSNGGLQVRVGGGWMGAIPFLERYGPAGMVRRPGDETPRPAPCSGGFHGVASGMDHLSAMMDTPPSMERLLVPTKCWAQKIGINTTPDHREQRRFPAPEDHREQRRLPAPEDLRTAPAEKQRSAAGTPNVPLKRPAAVGTGAKEADCNVADGPTTRLQAAEALGSQALMPLPWPAPGISSGTNGPLSKPPPRVLLDRPTSSGDSVLAPC